MDLASLTVLAQIDFSALSPFLWGAFLVAVVMLVWDTIEVGRNDAANLVNAAYGARILPRRSAVWVAGIGVVAGACPPAAKARVLALGAGPVSRFRTSKG